MKSPGNVAAVMAPKAGGLQVLLVGMTVGMMRNVVPVLAESEFCVPCG